MNRQTPKESASAPDAAASQTAVINAIPAVVWTALPDGSRDFHSERWLHYSGLSPEEGYGDGWLAIYHPEDRERVLQEWHTALATGEPYEVEARGRDANGVYRWFLVRAEPLRDSAGAIVKWYGTSFDIEDRKRAIEALRESEEQWRDVFEHNPVMYFIIDEAGTVLSVNGFGAAQLGYTVDELVGQSVLGVFSPEDREFVQKNVAVCLGDLGRSHSWEVRKIRKDGTVLWVRENAKAVRRAGNELIVLVACEDITERRRAEEQLHQVRAELAHVARLATAGELTALIAHEVNQPLTGIVTSGKAALRWLAAETPNVEAARRSVARMVGDAIRAAEVIARLRGLVKKSPPSRNWLNVNETIMEVVALIRGEVQRNRILLRTELSQDLPQVFGDRIELQQVILNLLMNAIDAMNDVNRARRELLVVSEKNGGDVRVAIHDSGAGLDTTTRERLFEPFYTTKAAGMGMGLAVSRTIVEAHGGELWAVPNAPEGAVFQFRLPARRSI